MNLKMRGGEEIKMLKNLIAVFFTIYILVIPVFAFAQSQLEKDNVIESVAVGDEESYLASVIEEMMGTPPSWGVVPIDVGN
jgi:hypothetical protein